MTGTALAIRDDQTAFDDGQRAALAVLGVDNANQHELAVFMHACQRTGLDPFSRQIYYIKRDGRWTIQTGIDGFRVIRDRVAARTHSIVEYCAPVWYDGDDGEHGVWTKAEPPAACAFTVLKNGKPFKAVVMYLETVQYNREGKVNSTWTRRPAGQLAKCAEAAALRMAFPHDLGDLYIAEEMPDDTVATAGQIVDGYAPRVTAADITGERAEQPSEPESSARPVTVMSASAADRGKLTRALKFFSLDDDDARTICEWLGGVPFIPTTHQARTVTGCLSDYLAAAEKDVEQARSNMWARYHEMHPQGGTDDV